MKDARAQEALVLRMEDEIISHVMQCSTAQEMWEKLETIFERKSEVSVHLLNEQFYNLKFNDEDVNTFISKVTNLRAKLKQNGEDIPEKMVLTKIIMSLPEKFRHFQSAWESVSSNSQTLNNLTARLLIEEERLKKEEEQSVALVTYQRSQNHNVNKDNRKCFACGKLGHVKSQCRNIECNNCKKKGHLMKDCFSKKKKEERNKTRENGSNSKAAVALLTVSNEVKSEVNME